MRSLLFVPGDDEKKLLKALGSGADALIIDLEDSVAQGRKEGARAITRAFLQTHVQDPQAQDPQAPRLFVRVNALGTDQTSADLDGVMAGRPAGIVLPKSESGADVAQLGARIAVREAENNSPDGATKIIAIATETARSLFHMGTYGGASQRLLGLTWGGEDLSADVGAEANRLENGNYTDPYRLARSLCVFAASAAEVMAIDSVYTNFRDMDGLRAEAEAARRDGFTAKMTIHPAQVPVINAVFTPSAETVARAQAIVELFGASPQAGVLSLNGEMLDRPHLRRAQRILARVRGV
jgi:citrate lyase subunit beta / citryl-CoA lyase